MQNGKWAMREVPPQEGEVPCEPDFPLGLARQHHPPQILAGLFDHFTSPEQGVGFSRRAFPVFRYQGSRISRQGKPRLRRSFVLERRGFRIRQS
jgi:hypothetical protein